MMRDRRDRIDGHTPRSDLDEVMRLSAVIGVVALTTWTLTSSVGVLSGYLAVSTPATIRFLAAVVVLVFSRRAYWGVRERRWRKLPADERFGFSSPPAEHGRGAETGSRQPRS